MGQQQLLLLVLSIIIAGLAIVMGMAAFSRNQVKANADNLVNEALRIASDVQTWSVKPTMVGGPTDSETLADVTFNKIGYSNSGGTYTTPDGDFLLETTLGADCDTPVVPSGNTPVIYVNASNADTGNSICIAIAGDEAEDIGTDAKYGSGITS